MIPLASFTKADALGQYPRLNDPLTEVIVDKVIPIISILIAIYLIWTVYKQVKNHESKTKIIMSILGTALLVIEAIILLIGMKYVI